MALERPALADAARASGFWRDLSLTHAAGALVGFLFAATGPVAVILATGTRGGLSEADLASRLFGRVFINGSSPSPSRFAYRQPLAFFLTIRHRSGRPSAAHQLCRNRRRLHRHRPADAGARL
jgi:benzoate membrane transport protein